MMDNCQTCGFEAQRGARFCRQCGSPLFVENEATMASTRQQFGGAAPQTPRRPFNQATSEEDAVDTARFYRPPGIQQAPAYLVPTPKGTTATFWLLMSLVSALAIIGLISAVLISTRVNRRDLGDVISERVERQIEQEAEKAARNAEELAARTEEAARRAAVPNLPAPSAPAPPLPPPVPGSKVSSINELVYPGAIIEKRTLPPGSQSTQIMKMATSDGIDEVREFYEIRLGEPTSARAATRLTFTSSNGGTNTIVKISPHPTLKGHLEIELTRSSVK